jgi:hypothetical protein
VLGAVGRHIPEKIYNIKKKKKKNWGEDAEFYFIFLLIAFQILYVFLPDISVHYALIEYARI